MINFSNSEINYLINYLNIKQTLIKHHYKNLIYTYKLKC